VRPGLLPDAFAPDTPAGRVAGVSRAIEAADAANRGEPLPEPTVEDRLRAFVAFLRSLEPMVQVEGEEGHEHIVSIPFGGCILCEMTKDEVLREGRKAEVIPLFRADESVPPGQEPA
jgi:hypothetical protein